MLIIQEILGYFLIALISMLGLAILYLPFYFILRKKITFLRQAAYFLFAVCIIVILAATVLETITFNIMDGKGIFAAERSFNIIPFKLFTENWLMGERKKLTQIIANIVMFAPLGCIFPIIFVKTRKLWKTTIYMALFSFFIEFIQYFIGRSADIDDLMLNTIGGMLGYFVFYIFSRLFHKKKTWKKSTGSLS